MPRYVFNRNTRRANVVGGSAYKNLGSSASQLTRYSTRKSARSAHSASRSLGGGFRARGSHIRGYPFLSTRYKPVGGWRKGPTPLQPDETPGTPLQPDETPGGGGAALQEVFKETPGGGGAALQEVFKETRRPVSTVKNIRKPPPPPPGRKKKMSTEGNKPDMDPPLESKSSAGTQPPSPPAAPATATATAPPQAAPAPATAPPPAAPPIPAAGAKATSNLPAPPALAGAKKTGGPSPIQFGHKDAVNIAVYGATAGAAPEQFVYDIPKSDDPTSLYIQIFPHFTVQGGGGGGGARGGAALDAGPYEGADRSPEEIRKAIRQQVFEGNVKQKIATGMSEEEAKKSALILLGDPNATSTKVTGQAALLEAIRSRGEQKAAAGATGDPPKQKSSFHVTGDTPKQKPSSDDVTDAHKLITGRRTAIQGSDDDDGSDDDGSDDDKATEFYYRAHAYPRGRKLSHAARRNKYRYRMESMPARAVQLPANPNPYNPTQTYVQYPYPTVMVPSNYGAGGLRQQGMFVNATAGRRRGPSMIQFQSSSAV